MERLLVLFIFLCFLIPLCNSTLFLKGIKKLSFESVVMSSHSYFGLGQRIASNHLKSIRNSYHFNGMISFLLSPSHQLA